MQLDEVRDKMIKEVHLTIPVEELTASFVQEFSEKIISAQGKRRKSEQKEKSFATLRMAVVDRKMGVTLNMYSRKYKVELTRDLVDYFDSQELKYTLS